MSTCDAIRGALSHRSYQLLTAGFFVCGFHIAFITTHLPPYLADLGFSGGLAASAVALIGLFNVIGAYSAGVLGGRKSKRLPAQRHLLLARGRVLAVPRRADLAVQRDRVRRRDRPAVAVDGPADVRAWWR